MTHDFSHEAQNKNILPQWSMKMNIGKGKEQMMTFGIFNQIVSI